MYHPVNPLIIQAPSSLHNWCTFIFPRSVHPSPARAPHRIACRGIPSACALRALNTVLLYARRCDATTHLSPTSIYCGGVQTPTVASRASYRTHVCNKVDRERYISIARAAAAAPPRRARRRTIRAPPPRIASHRIAHAPLYISSAPPPRAGRCVVARRGGPVDAYRERAAARCAFAT